MPSNTTVADAVLKVGYGDIHEQLDSYTVALNLMSKGSKNITAGNKEAQFAVHTRRNWGIGARGEGEDLPAAGQNKDARATVYLRYQYGRIEGTGQVFAQVKTNAQAFVDWMDREVKGIIETLKRDLNRQLYGDGTGTLALLTASATAATTLTVDSTLWFEEDQTIDVLTAASLGNPTPTSAMVSGTLLTITAIDPVASTITVSGGTVTGAVGSAVVLASAIGSTRTTNWKKEWEGLGSIVSTTSTLHNINPSTEPRWKAGYVENSVGTLAEVDLTHLAQGIHQKGTKITDILTTYGVVNAYWNTLQGLRRYDGSDKLKGGVTTPVFQSLFGDIPITMDWACPKGTLYGVNREDWFLNQIDDWKWIDETGSRWQQVPNKDALSATVKKYANVGVYRRNSFGKLTGITEV
jgi:hypothetical protein